MLKMKHIIRLTILLMVAIPYASNAQEGQSLRTQIKNNSVPGWQYDRSATTSKAIVATNNNEKHDESLVTQIRKGTAPGMRFMPVPANSNTSSINTQKAIVARTGSLPSEQTRNAEPAVKITAPAPPTQDN
jgi:hypothetical protein